MSFVNLESLIACHRRANKGLAPVHDQLISSEGFAEASAKTVILTRARFAIDPRPR